MKSLSLILGLCLLSGCVTRDIIHTEVVTPYIPALPAKVHFEPVEWHVVVLPEIKETREPSTNKIPYFALDTENYENLSKNIAATTAYLQKLRVLLYSIQTTNYTTTTNSVVHTKPAWNLSLNLRKQNP